MSELTGFRDEDWARLGNEMRKARTTRALTQKQAAAGARISETTWRELERGQRRGARSLTLAAIASFLDWHVDAPIVVLFGGDIDQHDEHLAADILTGQVLELDQRLGALEDQMRDLVALLRDDEPRQ